MKLKTLLTALGIGAGLMYFGDPELGERRRTMLRERANAWVNDTEDMVDAGMKDARNRARGVMAELSGRLSGQGVPVTGGAPTTSQDGEMAPAARLAASAFGTMLLIYGLTRRGLAKPVLSTAGFALATRGMTNLDTRSMLGLGMGEHGTQARKTINIDVPVDTVYQFWHNFENFPRFMEHVKDIRVQDGLTDWTVSGPAGVPVHFQSRITQDVPDQLIAWETVPDSQVQSSGSVRFDENQDGGTRVTVQMSYVPPAGVAGHAVAELFGADPRHAMDDDLMRLKSMLEQGRNLTGDAG